LINWRVLFVARLLQDIRTKDFVPPQERKMLVAIVVDISVDSSSISSFLSSRFGTFPFRLEQSSQG
jgi:hypothetical protein